MADVENNGNNGNAAENIEVDESAILKRKLVDEATDAAAAVADDQAAANVPVIKKAKVESEAVEPSKLESDIIRQIEYYFGDANLFRDKFLQTEIAKDDGWVPLATMLSFKRLAALSTDPEVIIAAVNKSNEGLVEISEDHQRIRRHPERPLPEKNEETRKELIARTAYVKGFPLDCEMADYIDFFDSYPKVTNIVVRKYLDKPTKVYKPKGSAFVTFSSVEQCGDFLKIEKVQFRGTDLIKKWQNDYYTEKKAEKSEKSKEKKTEPEIVLPKGAIVLLEGIAPNITRESIKAVFEELGGEVSFIDFQKGDEVAHVRLNTENSAQPIVDKLEGAKFKVEESECSARVVTGDDETAYLAKAIEQIRLRRKGHNHKKNRRYTRN